MKICLFFIAVDRKVAVKWNLNLVGFRDAESRGAGAPSNIRCSNKNLVVSRPEMLCAVAWLGLACTTLCPRPLPLKLRGSQVGWNFPSYHSSALLAVPVAGVLFFHVLRWGSLPQLRAFCFRFVRAWALVFVGIEDAKVFPSLPCMAYLPRFRVLRSRRAYALRPQVRPRGPIAKT